MLLVSSSTTCFNLICKFFCKNLSELRTCLSSTFSTDNTTFTFGWHLKHYKKFVSFMRHVICVLSNRRERKRSRRNYSIGSKQPLKSPSYHSPTMILEIQLGPKKRTSLKFLSLFKTSNNNNQNLQKSVHTCGALPKCIFCY